MKTFVPFFNSFNRLIIILAIILVSLSAKAQTYTTKTNGAWSSPSTWMGGSVPNATNITATTIINIKHVVTYSGGNISNFGTIRISNTGGVTARLIVPSGVNITNQLTGKIYVNNAELRQYRFAGGMESGTAQSGDFKNSGGYVSITNSYVEIARNWSNETAGLAVFRNSVLVIGQNYDLKTLAIDTLEYTSVSVGMQGSGDYTIDGLNCYFKSFRAQVASTIGKFNMKSGIINGNIDYIMLKNHVTGVYSNDKITVGSGVVTTGLSLSAYCIGNPSNYQPNGKISGAQSQDCSLDYFPASLMGTESQASMNLTTSPVLVSGTNLQVGAVYKYEGVAPGMDAYVRIDSLVGGATITMLDDNSNGSGFVEGFQPQIKSGSGVGQSYAVFVFTFKVTGTSKTHSMNRVTMTALDIDGTNTLKEFDEINMGSGATASYNMGLPAISLVQVAPGTFRGTNTDGKSVGGVDTSARQYMFTVSNTNLSTFSLKLGVTKTSSSQETRLFSVYMKGFAYPNFLSLPVELVSFTAALNQKQDKAELKWTTATELNVSHFVIEKSYDGTNFNDVGIVFAFGNTNEKVNYSFTDNIANKQKTIIYYRLRSVDNDNKFELSETRLVRLSMQDDDIRMVAYPNPVSNELKVTLPSTWQGKAVILEIFNQNGQRIKLISSGSASQTETIPVNDLVKGFYLVKATCGVETAQQKIIKN